MAMVPKQYVLFANVPKSFIDLNLLPAISFFQAGSLVLVLTTFLTI